MSVISVRSKNQYKFKNQTVFSEKVDKQDEENQVLNETEFFNNLNTNHNLTETDIDKIDIKSLLEHQIRIQDMKDSGWRFKKNSMTTYVHKTNEMNASSCLKTPLKKSGIFNIEIDEKRFVWSKLASLHPCRIGHPN